MVFSISKEDHAAHVQWNADWERKLDASYFPGVENLGNILDRMAPTEKASILGANLGPHEHLEHRKRIKAVCELQKDLTSLAIECLVADDLQTKWDNSPQDRREEFALEGIWRAAHIADFERFREWCPELTVGNLARRSEAGFIQLVKSLIPERPEIELTAPIFIPNPVLAKLLPQEKEISLHDLVNQTLLSRCYLITMTLWQIMLALYDIKEDYLAPRESSKDASQHRRLKQSPKLLPKETARELRQMHVEDSKRRTSIDLVHICEYCRRPQSDLDKDHQLKACTRCKKIGRTVMYCSRECQTKDWKIGFSISHKQICGLSSLDDIELATRQEARVHVVDERIPPPDPSFKRSLALLHQISFLKEPPYADYAFIIAPPEDAALFNYPDLDGRIAFIVFRQRALCTGDAGAVAFMFKVLSPFARGLGSSREALKKQLQDEYGVDIDSSLDIEPILPTDEEMGIAAAIIMKSDRAT